MENIMELDELKATWQALDRKMTRSNAIQLQLFKDGKLKNMRAGLRPLFWGQVVQMIFGVPFILLAGLLWYRVGTFDLPLPVPLLIAGIIVHAYGVITVAMAGQTLSLISRIDYSAPVLVIQKQLATLRRTYIVNGMLSGLPWWFLWVPLLMVLAGLSGGDLYAKAPSVVWIGMGVGIVGLLATWWFHRWSRNPKRPRLAKAMEDSVTGGSLRKARQLIDEIARFEKE